MHRRYTGSWVDVTDPDNAASTIEWEREIEAKHFNSSVLEAFSVERAKEGGISIVFYGTDGRLQAIRDLLHGEGA